MNNNELEKQADLIWSILNCKENSDKNKQEQLALIKPVINAIGLSERNIGRNQILNHMSIEIDNLTNNN